MHQTPRRTLIKIVAQYGDELIDDPRRTEALLNDLCGKHTREIFVLTQAQRRRVPAELRAAPAWMPISTTVNRLTRNLESQLALTPEAAAWAVAAWAQALGLLDAPAASRWFKLLPNGFWRADQAGQHPQSKKTSQAGGKAENRRGRKPARQKLTGQNGISVVQSPQEDRSRAGKQTSPGGTVKSQAILQPARSRLGRFSVHLRQQAPNVLLWTTVLLISSALVWTMLYGAALSDSLLPPENESAQPTVIATTAADSGSSATTPPELAPGHSALTQHYAPPQIVRVTATDGLNLRAGPSLDATRLGSLPVGASVTVVGYSPDGRWAQLDSPQTGWVSIDYLAFNTTIGRQVRILLRSGRIQPQLETVTLHAEPSVTTPRLHELQGSTEVAIVAETMDSQWYHISIPSAGWLMTGAVELAPPELDDSESNAVGYIPAPEGD